MGIKIENISSQLLYTFGVTSDLHIGEKQIYVDHFKTAIKALKDKGAEFITIAGDISRKGQGSNELTDYSNNDNNCDGRDKDLDILMESVTNSGVNIPLYMCGGNHDVAQKNSKWNTTVNELGRNKLNPKNIEICEYNEKTYSALINNDLFMFISFDRAFGDDTYIESIPWAIQKLNENSNKRVFMFIHYPLLDGVAGEFKNEYFGFSKNAKSNIKLINAINEHENVIVFSGHTHHPYELADIDERNDNVNFYLLNNNKNCALMLAGVTSYSINDTTAIEPWVISPDYAPEGSIVKVYDNKVVIIPMNLGQRKTLGKEYIVYSKI